MSGIFNHDELDKSVGKWLRQRRTAGNGKIGAQNVYIAISGYRSLSQSLDDIFIELAMVENAGFAVGISMLFTVPRIKVFLFRQRQHHRKRQQLLNNITQAQLMLHLQ